MTPRPLDQGRGPAGAGRGGETVRPLSGKPESLFLLLTVLIVLGSLAGYLLLRPAKAGPPTPLSWQVRSFDGLGPVDQAIHGALLPAGEEIIWNNNDTGGWITMDRAQEILLPPFYRDGFWKTNGQVNWQLILPGTHQAHALPPGVNASSHEKDHDKEGHDDKDHEEAAPPRPPPAPPPQEPSSSQLTTDVAKATLGQGAAIYYGSGGKAKGQGAYLLVIGHAHAGVMWANQATIWIHANPNAPYPGIVKPESLVSKGWRQVIPYDGALEVERVKGNS